MIIKIKDKDSIYFNQKFKLNRIINDKFVKNLVEYIRERDNKYFYFFKKDIKNCEKL
jgi:Mn-containing catalase